MAIELITGRAGKAHIGSEDDRAYHAYTNGEGRYILNGGTANIESANNVHVDPVEFLVDGAHVRVTGAGEDVAIENGVASYKRIDVIALHYTRTGNDDNYIESVEFAVVKGANVELGNEAQVPDMPKSGTILTGANDVYVPVYSLLIDALTPKNLTTLLEEYALPVANGGTGQTSLQAARNAMGLGNTTGALPVANGGTGAGNAASARTNLGLNDYITSAGTSGNWNYIKYASGLKICVLKPTEATIQSMATLAGGLYFGYIFGSKALPFAFSSYRDVIVVNTQYTNGGWKAFISGYETADNASLSTVGKVNVVRWNTETPVVYGLVVIGV